MDNEIFFENKKLRIKMQSERSIILSSFSPKTDRLNPKFHLSFKKYCATPIAPEKNVVICMRLLLIEDDQMISHELVTAFRREGYAVDAVADTQSARLSLTSETYDLVLLDLGLPDGSGLDVLKELRGHRDQIPVLIITARDTLKDIVTGLDLGADDYMIKPFALEELEARIRVLLRRSQGRASPVITWGNIELNPATHSFSIDGRKIILSAREFAVLHTLMENPENVISRKQLEDKIYGWNEEVESNTIEYHISQLRKKIGRDAIRNIRGVGYILEKRT